MKKFLSALICLVLLSLTAACIAEETQSDQPEILFRGIPYLVSITEAVETLNPDSLGIKGRVRNDEKMYSWGVDYLNVSSENAGFKYSASETANILFVAGHSVGELHLYALYGYTDDYVSTNADDSQFYEGVYYFDDEDKAAAFDDLHRKLSDLYGDPAEQDEDDREKYAIWYGANRTGAILKLSKYASGDYLSLSYGRTDADELIYGLKAAFAHQNKGDSYDGL